MHIGFKSSTLLSTACGPKHTDISQAHQGGTQDKVIKQSTPCHHSGRGHECGLCARRDAGSDTPGCRHSGCHLRQWCRQHWAHLQQCTAGSKGLQPWRCTWEIVGLSLSAHLSLTLNVRSSCVFWRRVNSHSLIQCTILRITTFLWILRQSFCLSLLCECVCVIFCFGFFCLWLSSFFNFRILYHCAIFLVSVWACVWVCVQ